MSAWHGPDLFTFCLVALGGPLLGLFLLATDGRARTAGGRCFGVGLCLVLAGLGLTRGASQALDGEPAGRWLPPVLVGLLLGLFAARLSPAGGRFLNVLAGARLQGLVLLVVLPLAAFGWSAWLAEQGAPTFPMLPQSAAPNDEPVVNPAVQGFTDLGTPIPIYQAGGTRATPARLADWERDVLQQFAGKLIRTADVSAHYNCHGWTFAGGEHWIVGRDVPTILEDNGYREVSDPRPGDVVVYREADGTVAHSGLVRTITPEGQVLVESKWGWFGRFLHAPEVQGYGTSYSYLRCDRSGHAILVLPTP